MDGTCPRDCLNAETPEEECECSCGGKRHGSQSKINDFDSGRSSAEEGAEQNQGEEQLTCLVCGFTTNYTDPEMCAVDSGTPLADALNLDKSQEHDGFLPVCDTCYDRGCDSF